MSRMTGKKKELIAARLAEIEARGKGRLTPESVVDDARDPKSPLHDQFEWDVRKAAHRWNIEQARELIVTIRYQSVTEKTEVEVKFYHRDPTAAGNEPGYVSIETLRSDTDMARMALVDAFRRVGDELRRAQQLAIVLDLDAEVGKLLNGVWELRERIAEAPRQMM